MHEHVLNFADPIGMTIVVAGVIATVLSFVLAFRMMLWPGETAPDHPKLDIFRKGH